MSTSSAEYTPLTKAEVEKASIIYCGLNNLDPQELVPIRHPDNPNAIQEMPLWTQFSAQVIAHHMMTFAIEQASKPVILEGI